VRGLIELEALLFAFEVLFPPLEHAPSQGPRPNPRQLEAHSTQRPALCCLPKFQCLALTESQPDPSQPAASLQPAENGEAAAGFAMRRNRHLDAGLA
jgi:hypothetical protein